MDIELYKAMSDTNPPMPVVYQNAKQALITCTKLDECKDWADKMSALSSYAKQADNPELEILAKKIRAHAMKRCGELLREFDGRGDHWKSKRDGDDHFTLTQKTAGENAHMSERQIKESVQIANVPDDLFEELVESDKPPTITQLAELGKKNEYVISVKNKSAFATAIHFRGTLEDLYNKYLEIHEPQFYFDGMEDWQKDRAKNVIPKITSWLNEFMELD
jgi:hypothetical protein